MVWIKNIFQRLKKPSVILSIVSQVIPLLLAFEFDFDNQFILSIATILCAILVTLGILSNPDTENNGYGDDVLFCSKENKFSSHIKINGKMVCKECGCAHSQS